MTRGLASACRTHFRFTRELENLGAVARASASREQMAYFIDSAKVSEFLTWYVRWQCLRRHHPALAWSM